MTLTSVSVYELSRMANNYGQPPPASTAAAATAVRRRSNSTKVRRRADESLDRRRRSHNEHITISYLGRPASPPVSTILKTRKPSPTPMKKTPSTSSIPTTSSSQPIKKTSGFRSQKTSSPTTSSESTSTTWIDCIEMVNEIGAVAKRECRNIRKVRIAVARRIKFEHDEEMVLTAARILSKWHGWTLESCLDYLPVLIDNLTNPDYRSRSIALVGLAAISDDLTEKIVKFSNCNAHRIGVDVAAEERSEKAKMCVQMLRGVVKKRDWLYRQLDEEGVDRLDATMERLKRI